MIEITLTKGYVAKIDDEDADLAGLGWWATVNGRNHVYAQRKVKVDGKHHNVYLHRLVGERMGTIPPGFDVDHRHGNTLDCRRSEMRIVPHRVNLHNRRGANRNSRSGVPGVRERRNGRWAAYICTGLKMRSLGQFGSMDEAVAARRAAERERGLSTIE